MTELVTAESVDDANSGKTETKVDNHDLRDKHDAYNEHVLLCWVFACECCGFNKLCLKLGDLDFVTHGYLKKLRQIEAMDHNDGDAVKEEISTLIDGMTTFWEVIGVVAALIGAIAVDASLNGLEYASGSLVDSEDWNDLHLGEYGDLEEIFYIVYSVCAILSGCYCLLCVFFCTVYYAILTAVIDDERGIEDFLKYFPTWVPVALLGFGLVFFILGLSFAWIVIHPWRVILAVGGFLTLGLFCVCWMMLFWIRMSREITMRSKLVSKEAADKLLCCPCRGSVKYY